MSAFMPDNEHFRWLVSYAIAYQVSWTKVPMTDRKALQEMAQEYESIWRNVTFDTADEVMRMLKHETYKSLSARYADPIPKLEDVEVVSIPADYGSPDHDVIGRLLCFELRKGYEPGHGASNRRAALGLVQLGRDYLDDFMALAFAGLVP